MEIDLNSLSKAELEKLAADVQKALNTLETRRMAEARRELEKRAKELGFSFEELTAGPKSKSKSPPKYVHPENPTKTWTGRGRQPAWIREGLAAGKTLDDFAI